MNVDKIISCSPPGLPSYDVHVLADDSAVVVSVTYGSVTIGTPEAAREIASALMAWAERDANEHP